MLISCLPLALYFPLVVISSLCITSEREMAELPSHVFILLLNVGLRTQ